jgi:hypothetical protein
MVRSLSWSTLAILSKEQWPLGRARGFLEDGTETKLKDAGDLLWRRIQRTPFLIVKGGIDHRAWFRQGCHPSRQTVQLRSQHHVCAKGVRKGLPAGPFDNIVWDAAIEHFTEVEIDKLLREIVSLLGSDGILSGYTLTEAADGKKGNALHEYEFKNKEDLRRFFTPHFKFVKVWETIYPTRHNLYFAASQSEISPFD